jgi:hypothetical protein
MHGRRLLSLAAALLQIVFLMLVVNLFYRIVCKSTIFFLYTNDLSKKTKKRGLRLARRFLLNKKEKTIPFCSVFPHKKRTQNNQF